MDPRRVRTTEEMDGWGNNGFQNHSSVNAVESPHGAEGEKAGGAEKGG